MLLSRAQGLRLAAVLEDCSDQQDILGHTLMVQISREQQHAAAQEKRRLTKLRGDCWHVSQQVSELHLELEETQSFSSLQQVVEEVEQREAERMRREAKKEMEKRKRALKRRQQEERHEKIKKLQDTEDVIQGLECQLNEQSSKAAHRKRILEKNNEARLEETQKESSVAEQQLEDQLELLHHKLKDETRVHEESERFLQNQHEELQQQLQQWQEHTKQMLQEREQQLNNVSCRRTVNIDRLAETRRKLMEMEQVVIEDREEQEKLCQQEAEVRAATKLQAWWRGCMVRRGLGSFKKADETKKGKKKEGKKKKKK